MTTTVYPNFLPRPFTKIRLVDRPLQVGDVLFHKSWTNNFNDYYEILEVSGGRVRVYGRFTNNVQWYETSIFAPYDDWWLIREAKPPEPKKSGFGRFSKKVMETYGT